MQAKITTTEFPCMEGCTGILSGILSKPELNGQKVTVVKQPENDLRVAVQLESGKIISVNKANITINPVPYYEGLFQFITENHPFNDGWMKSDQYGIVAHQQNGKINFLVTTKFADMDHGESKRTVKILSAKSTATYFKDMNQDKKMIFLQKVMEWAIETEEWNDWCEAFEVYHLISKKEKKYLSVFNMLKAIKPHMKNIIDLRPRVAMKVMVTIGEFLETIFSHVWYATDPENTGAQHHVQIAEKAIKAYQFAICIAKDAGISPDDTIFCLGSCFQRVGRPKEALENFQIAYDMLPEHEKPFCKMILDAAEKKMKFVEEKMRIMQIPEGMEVDFTDDQTQYIGHYFDRDIFAAQFKEKLKSFVEDTSIESRPVIDQDFRDKHSYYHP